MAMITTPEVNFTYIFALLYRLMTSNHWTKSPGMRSPLQSLEAASWAASWPVPSAGDVRLQDKMRT